MAKKATNIRAALEMHLYTSLDIDTSIQGGQRTSRSRANNSKQLALQKKITSDKVRKSVISRVLKFQFLFRKA